MSARAYSCYTIQIRLEKWLVRKKCECKRDVKLEMRLYNKTKEQNRDNSLRCLQTLHNIIYKTLPFG